jgi:uncharacterized protein (TIGR00288 family)
MESFQTKNIALFIDFENIHSEEFDVEVLVEKLKERGRLIIKKAYGDWGRFIRVKQTMLFNSVELVELPQVGYRGKNSSDIKLTIDALETAFNRPYIDTYVVVSGDSDFTPLISKLRELDKYVIVVSSKENTSKLLKGFCDELIYLSSVSGGDGAEKLSLQTGYNVLRRAVESLENLRGEARGSLVKSQMLRLDPSFTEENFGFKQFRRFLEQAARDGVIRLKSLGDGETRVSLPGAEKAAPEPAKKEPPPRLKPAPAVPAAVEPAPAITLDADRLNALTGTILLGLSLARRQDQLEVDLNELAHCCKRLDAHTAPEHYGIPKSRGFKGLVHLLQEQGLVQLSYQAQGNHYWVRLTPAGEERLQQLPRPHRYLEHRYRTLLKYGLFRARLNNEKLVHEALLAFLDRPQDQDQPQSVRQFLSYAASRINMLGTTNIRHIVEAIRSIGGLTLDGTGENGAADDALLVQVKPWPAVVKQIVRWHMERLQEETGEPFKKELYLQILREENTGNPMGELSTELDG